MSWAKHHSRSERYAGLAERAAGSGDYRGALELYGRAAAEEASALSCLSSRKTRTRGITAVRAVSLWLNAGNPRQARRVADPLLREGSLPDFAGAQLRAMLLGNNVLIAPPRKTVRKGGSLVVGASAPVWLAAAAPAQITQLTPNSNCSAVGSGDINNSILVQFMSPPNSFAWWTAMTSDAIRPVMLSADAGNATVTFKQGLTLSYAPSGNTYYALVSGQILDNGTLYTITSAIVYKSTPPASQPATT